MFDYWHLILVGSFSVYAEDREGKDDCSSSLNDLFLSTWFYTINTALAVVLHGILQTEVTN